jgi:hypothetical protein
MEDNEGRKAENAISVLCINGVNVKETYVREAILLPGREVQCERLCH